MEKFLWLIFGGYFISWVISFYNFESREEHLGALQKKILMICLFLHLGILVCYAIRGVETVSRLIELAAPFLILTVALVMEWKSKVRFFMLFALPGVLVVMLLGILYEHAPSAAMHGWSETAWFWAHISFMLAGFAGFFTAVSSALMYLLQSKQLKSKHPGLFFLKLPALDTLDRVHFRSLVWGSILFSLGVLAGLFWATHLQTLGPVLKDPKVILSFITCGIYWVIIALRLSSLRRGQKIVAGTLVAFIFLFTTMAMSYIMPSAFHQGL